MATDDESSRWVALRTTVIGSYPKPSYLNIPDWFCKGKEKPGLLGSALEDSTAFLQGMSQEQKDDLEGDILKATREVIDQQCSCGVDVVTDGEIRRENYIHFLCRFIDGIDFAKLTEKSVRNGAFTAKLPTIVGPVRWRGGLSCASEWRKAQDVSKSPVKYTLPGPMTIMGSTHNEFYKDDRALAFDLAKIVNCQVLELAKVGCRHIQVDEPLFARKPDEALDYGISALEACFQGCPSNVERSMHMCCGYPGYVDQEGYLKADSSSYFRLAPALDASSLNAVSIEDAWCRNDLSLLSLFKQTSVILGSMHVSSSHVETVEEIQARLEEALKYIEPERLQVAPDCGLALLDGPHRDKLETKLKNMCLAAKRVRVSGKRKEPESASTGTSFCSTLP